MQNYAARSGIEFRVILAQNVIAIIITSDKLDQLIAKHSAEQKDTLLHIHTYSVLNIFRVFTYNIKYNIHGVLNMYYLSCVFRTEHI